MLSLVLVLPELEEEASNLHTPTNSLQLDFQRDQS